MIFNLSIQQILMLVPIFILSISFHEAAHAYAAHYFGDDTAKSQGRLTLNPLSHLDPVGTIVLLVAGFGWAKPVPVDSRNLRNPDLNMSAIAAAGPLLNLLLAVFCAIAFNLIDPKSSFAPIVEPLYIGVFINVILCLFNLLPLPPLDGGNIIRGFLPDNIKESFDQIAAYSMFIILLLVFLPGPIDYLMDGARGLTNWLIVVGFGWI